MTPRNARSDLACGRAIQTMIEGALNYCLEYKGVTDSPLGDDGVLGEEMKAILDGIRGLLDGPTGKLDCGEEWRRIQGIAERAGLLNNNGELF